jgi:hypothetical protein
MRDRGDRGAVSTFLAVLALAMLMAAGLAYDGGRKISALREASHIAESAARAGAQAVDPAHLRTTGQIMLDPDQAVALAGDYLADIGHTGQVTVAGDAVSVTVSITVDPVLLPVGEMFVSATETATAITEEPTT